MKQMIVGSLSIALGIAISSNAIICGPNAFAKGYEAVIVMTLLGIVCIAIGIYSMMAADEPPDNV